MPVLDPNVKDLYFKHRWNEEQYAAGMRQLEEVVSDFIEHESSKLCADPCLV